MALLKYGVLFDCEVHKSFSAKLLTVGGNCAVQEALAELNIDAESTNVRDKAIIDMAYLSQQVEIEGIPQDTLTANFLLENLSEEDHWVILEEILQLRKKRLGDTEAPMISNPNAEQHTHKTE